LRSDALVLGSPCRRRNEKRWRRSINEWWRKPTSGRRRRTLWSEGSGRCPTIFDHRSTSAESDCLSVREEFKRKEEALRRIKKKDSDWLVPMDDDMSDDDDYGDYSVCARSLTTRNDHQNNRLHR
jgi:hypothetical protein